MLSKNGKIIKPWDRKNYPGWKSLKELKKMNLMPRPNVKAIALVDRDAEFGGKYYLYEITKTMPYSESIKQKQSEENHSKEYVEKYSCAICGEHTDNSLFIHTGLCKRCYNKLVEVKQIKSRTFTENFRSKKYFEGKKTIALDVETTGFDKNKDEILQLAIVDHKGNPVFNELFKPENVIDWEIAERVHNITPENVLDKPCIKQRLELIQNIIDQADRIVGYNLDFDIGFLKVAGITIDEQKELYDLMKPFANIYGKWSEKYEDYVWQKLKVCADTYGYRFKEHDALEDAKAAMYCFPLVKCDYEFEKQFPIRNILK